MALEREYKRLVSGDTKKRHGRDEGDFKATPKEKGNDAVFVELTPKIH